MTLNGFVKARPRKRNLKAAIRVMRSKWYEGTYDRFVSQLASVHGCSHEEAIPETLFSQLSWRQENGAKLGAYEIALIQDNDRDQWQKAYDFLQNQGSTISSRFHEEAYQYSYWLYDQMDYKIFRQRLKEATK